MIGAAERDQRRRDEVSRMCWTMWIAEQRRVVVLDRRLERELDREQPAEERQRPTTGHGLRRVRARSRCGPPRARPTARATSGTRTSGSNDQPRTGCRRRRRLGAAPDRGRAPPPGRPARRRASDGRPRRPPRRPRRRHGRGRCSRPRRAVIRSSSHARRDRPASAIPVGARRGARASMVGVRTGVRAMAIGRTQCPRPGARPRAGGADSRSRSAHVEPPGARPSSGTILIAARRVVVVVLVATGSS